MILGHPFVNVFNDDKGLGVSFTEKSHATVPTWFSRRDFLGHESRSVRYLWRDASHAVCILQRDSFLRLTKTVSMFQGCFENIDQFACVAVDAVFAGLLFLENVLKSSGVFFLKRNGNVGKGRIGPSLQKSVASIV